MARSQPDLKTIFTISLELILSQLVHGEATTVMVQNDIYDAVYKALVLVSQFRTAIRVS